MKNGLSSYFDLPVKQIIMKIDVMRSLPSSLLLLLLTIKLFSSFYVGARLNLYYDQLMADVALWLTIGKASLERELNYIQSNSVTTCNNT